VPQEPHRPVAAARAENRFYRRVCERGGQLSESAGVVTREIAVTFKNSGIVVNAVAFGNDGQAGVE
jgi:hypothetical protein